MGAYFLTNLVPSTVRKYSSDRQTCAQNHKYSILTPQIQDIHIHTRQILLASWGEPEVYHHVVVKKHSARRLTVSVQRTVNRIEAAL